MTAVAWPAGPRVDAGPGDRRTRLEAAAAEAAFRALADAPDTRLLDWFACRVGDPGDPITVHLQFHAAGERLRLEIEAPRLMPSAREYWPATGWPQREATERLGLRFADEPVPQPLWTAAAREATDREDGLAPEPDDLVRLLDAGAATAWRLDLRARVRRGTIEATRVRPGRLHCGFEARARERSFAQLPVLAEGLNDQAPGAPALAAVLAAESLLGLVPPPRCRRVRTVLAEVGRIAAHCAWLAAQCAFDPWLWARALAVRDGAARFLADASGRRWGTGVQRLGGIAADLTDRSPELLATLRAEALALCRAAAARTVEARAWRRRFEAVAALDGDTALAMAVSGPNLRAAGVDYDVRRAHPYLDYEAFDFEVPLGDGGDVVQRVAVRLREIEQSLSICRQALDDVPGGELTLAPAPDPADGTAARIEHFEAWMEGHGARPAPDAAACVPTESADGELACFLDADGTGKPEAVHLRSPSLYHQQVLPALLTGVALSRAPAVVASLNIVASEADR